MPELPPGLLVLEDGSTFAGRSAGADRDIAGQVVFNTCMTGHQEIVSDPACVGQLIVFTCPHVGNVGVNAEDDESPRPAAGAVLTRALTRTPSNWRAERSFADWLAEAGVPALTGLDTRRLTLHLRQRGAMRGAVGVGDPNAARLLEMARSAPAAPAPWPTSRATPTAWTQAVTPAWDPAVSLAEPRRAETSDGPHIVVLDLGTKGNVLRHLVSLGARVTVTPPRSAQMVLALEPDGLLVSSGPGDPREAASSVAIVQELVGRLPLFGIGLGCQILALALGARVVPLRAGHHGYNYPVRAVDGPSVAITSQNHLYGIDGASLAGTSLEMTETNLFDGTVEGLRCTSAPAWGVLYQPEASPGPHDALHVLSGFVAAARTR